MMSIVQNVDSLPHARCPRLQPALGAFRYFSGATQELKFPRKGPPMASNSVGQCRTHPVLIFTLQNSPWDHAEAAFAGMDMFA